MTRVVRGEEALTRDVSRSAPCPASSAGLDTKVEIILAAAILSLIVLLFTWSVQ